MANKQNIRAHLGRHADKWFWGGVIVLLAALRPLIQESQGIGDEGTYVRQIAQFIGGNFRLDPYISVFPTYDLVEAFFARLFDVQTVQGIRTISFLGSSLCIYIFFYLASYLSPSERYIKTLHFLFLPVLFPFFFLVYTDAWALLFALLTVGAALQGRVMLSFLAGFCSIAFRPTNIFWVLLAWIFIVAPIFQSGGWGNRLKIRQAVGNSWGFVLLFTAFGIFVLVNHGVAIGDREHQGVSFNLNNGFYFCLLFSMLFLPDCIVAMRKTWKVGMRAPVILLGGLFVVFFVYWMTYKITHAYNDPGMWCFLRNRLLYWTTSYSLGKVAGGVFVVCGLSGLLFGPLVEEKFRLMVPIAVLSVLAMPLIEPRYYIVPFSFWILFRKGGSLKWELMLVALYFVASMILVYGIVTPKDRFLP